MDARQLLAGVIIGSASTFAEKIAMLFSLFDTRGDRCLNRDDLTLLFSTCLNALGTMCAPDSDRTPMAPLDPIAASIIRSIDAGGGKKISHAQLVGWATRSPSAVSVLCRHGTTDADIIKSKFSFGGISRKLYCSVISRVLVVSKLLTAALFAFRTRASGRFNGCRLGVRV